MALICSVAAGGALADTIYTGTGNWTEGGNWSGGQPGVTDTAQIGSGANVTVNSDVGTIKHLHTAGGASKTMNMDGGTLELAGSLINAFWNDFNLNLSNGSSFDHVSGVHNLFLSAGGASIDVDNSSFTMASGMQQYSASGTYSITVRNGSTFSVPSYTTYNGTNEFNVEGDGNTVTLNSFDAYFEGDGSHATNTFNLTPDATGIDAITVSGAVDLRGDNDTLNVDVSSYNTNNGMTLVLLDYGSLTGTFDATNITGFAGTDAAVDHDYHIDGAGDVAIALCLNGIEPISWDNDAGDNNWQTAANWSRDFVPTSIDDAYIGPGYIVTNAPNQSPRTFTSLEVAAGAEVTFNGENYNDVELTVRGTITNPYNVFRLHGSTTMHVYGTVSKGISLRNEITYYDGASQSEHFFIENQGARVINFVLSETGFTTVTPNWLFQQGLWSDATINVDISAYDRTKGTTIYLMDFSNYNSTDPEANFTNATRTVTGHAGGTVSWDATNDRIVLEIVPITGTIITVK